MTSSLKFDENLDKEQTVVINTPLTLTLYKKDEYKQGEDFRRLDVSPTKMPDTVFSYYPKNQEELQDKIDFFKVIDKPTAGGRRGRITKRFRPKRQHRRRHAKSRQRRA